MGGYSIFTISPEDNMAASAHSLIRPFHLAVPDLPSSVQLQFKGRISNNSCVAKCSNTQKKNVAIDKLETGPPRRSADYKPAICDNDFLQSLRSRYGEEKYIKQAEKMKDYARSLLLEEVRGAISSLELIDTLQRLGLGYLCEEEIKDVLEKRIINQRKEDDLDYTALRFRILRQHGYMIPQDDFTPYLDKNGAFMEGLKDDTRAVLSLYDASFLAMEGETLLDNARSFAARHLSQYLIRESPNSQLHRLVKHGLELPHYWRNPKLDARWSIDEYERDEKKNPKLLELAKLVYNTNQAGYACSIKAMSGWWKDQGLAEKLPFSRDRLPECFLWSLGYVSEPQYAQATEGLTQVIQILTTLDDIYDIYGTLDELELFTDAIERWDLHVLEELPEYMKLYYFALFNFVNEVGYITLKQHGCNIIPTLRKLWADICKAYLAEAKWFYEGHIPSFDEYINNAWVTISIPVISANALFLMNETITEDRLSLIHNYDELIQTTSRAIRLLDDLVTSNAERERGDAPKAVQCYVHEKGVSEEVAIEHVKSLVNESWKKLNKHLILGSPFSRNYVRTTMDFLKTAHWFYLHGDGFGSQRERTFDMFKSIVVDPLF